MISVACLGGPARRCGVGVAYWGGEQAFDKIGALDGGLYGIAIAAVGMLATTRRGRLASTPTAPSPTTPAASPRWPTSDPPVREVTDALDSLGNTTAAIAKGFAIGSAALTALALFKAFEFAMRLGQGERRSTSTSARSDGRHRPASSAAMLPFLVRRPDHRRRRPGRAADDRGGPPPVPGDPRPARGQGRRQARLRALRRHLHRAPRCKEMILPGALAVVVLRSSSASSASRRSAACWPARSSPAFAAGHLHGQRRWRLGQRQEVHRGRRITAARAPMPTRRPSSATPSVTRSRTPPAPR